MWCPTKAQELVSTTVKSEPVRILIADDQADVREALRLLLKAEGFATETVSSPAAALEAVQTNEFDIVLMDLNYQRDTTSGQEGIDLLSRVQQADSKLPIVVMTAWGSVELAVEAMRRGARDFIQKPWDNHRLLSIIRTQVDLYRTMRRAARLEAENSLLRAQNRPIFIAESQAMEPLLTLLSRIGPSRRERADHRRARHRKRSCGANAACAFVAQRTPHGYREHRRPARRHF